MLYELHVTTVPDADPDKWTALCRALNIKPLIIELTEGVYPRQVMMAATHSGDDDTAVEWRTGLCGAFVVSGFPIVRVKMEVPLDKGFGYVHAPYHEMHIKMLLDPIQVVRLEEAQAASGMYASRNALVPIGERREKWYLTARAYDVDGYYASETFSDGLAIVTRFLPGVRMEMETVIADSCPGLDEGWA